MINKKYTVAHFVRKSSQLKASFIKNQIINSIIFDPKIIYVSTTDKGYKGGFADFAQNRFPSFFSGSNRNLFWNKVFHYLKIISKSEAKKIINYLTENKIDILHFHYGTDAMIYWRVIRDAGIPSVVSFYGYDCSSFPLKWFRIGEKLLQLKCFRHCTIVTAMSAVMKEDLLKLGCPENKIVIHYHGIDTSFFNFERKYRSGGKINLLILSGLDTKKGHLFLLESLKMIFDAGDFNIYLRIAGDGPVRSSIEKKIIQYGLQNKVEMVGPIVHNSPEMSFEFQNADIFVHPSITVDNEKEGIPGAIVEAMASGLPVISTYHSGIPTIIEHLKTGWLVQENDTKSLGNAIIELSIHPELRISIGTQARQFAFNNLEIMEKERELENIYTGLLVGNN